MPIKTSKETNSAYGFEFCFDLYKENKLQLFNFKLFKAKYKKNSTEFTSSYKVLDYDFLIQNTSKLSQKDSLLFLKLFEFEDSY